MKCKNFNSRTIRFFIGLTLSALILADLSGCAHKRDHYRPYDIINYDVTHLDPTAYRVTVRGGKNTSTQKVEDLNLYRSARISLFDGYPYFIIVGSRTAEREKYQSAPMTATTSHIGASSFTTISGGNLITTVEPSATNIIVLFKDRPTNVNGVVYDAAFIMNSIGEKYGMPISLLESEPDPKIVIPWYQQDNGKK